MTTGKKGAVIVHLLHVGNDAPSNIADSIDSNPKYVSQMLSDLDDAELVEPMGSGVWALTPSGVTAAQAIVRGEDVDLDL